MSETVSETPAPPVTPVEPKVRKPAPKWLLPAAIALVVGMAVGGGIGAAANDKAAKVANLTSQLSTAKSTIGTLSDKVSANEKEHADFAAQSNELQTKLDQVNATLLQIKAGTIPGSGAYLVGTDVQPGTYRSEGNTGCYWARLGSADTSDINDNANVDGQAIVTILASDKVFETNRCSDWTKVG